MILAALDPLITAAVIGFLQAITVTLLVRNNQNTRRIKEQHEPNHGDSMYDRLDRVEKTTNHTREVVFALNRRQRAAERLHSIEHKSNVKRLVNIEDKLGIEDEENST